MKHYTIAAFLILFATHQIYCSHHLQTHQLDFNTIQQNINNATTSKEVANILKTVSSYTHQNSTETTTEQYNNELAKLEFTAKMNAYSKLRTLLEEEQE